MNEFKKGDIVFLKNSGKFAQIYSDPLSAKFIRLKVIEDQTGTIGYSISPNYNIVKVDPDTPQNRLAIQIKYG